MLKLADHVVRAAVMALMGMLLIVVLSGTADLALLLWTELTNPPVGMMDVREILEILGLFLMIMIAIEMVYVVRLYVVHRHLDVHAVLFVALIAIARKVVVLDLEKYDAMHMLGIAVLVMSLAGALFLLRRQDAPAPAP